VYFEYRTVQSCALQWCVVTRQEVCGAKSYLAASGGNGDDIGRAIGLVDGPLVGRPSPRLHRNDGEHATKRECGGIHVTRLKRGGGDDGRGKAVRVPET
jgi:hypothetical protein